MGFTTVTDIASPTGARLALRHQPAQGGPRAILLIHHGLVEHAGRYDDFARFMAKRGFHVFAHDHRGHGLTRADDAPLGTFAAANGPAAVVADCLAVHAHACRSAPGLPVVVLGHSMGGLVALNFAERHPDRVDALAIWNANFDLGRNTRIARAILAGERMLLGSDVPSRALPRLTFDAWNRTVPAVRTRCDWLSNVPENVDAYLADELCGFPPTIAMWRDVLTLKRAGSVEALRHLPKGLPIHLAGGGKDPATGGGQAVRRLAERARMAGLVNVTIGIDDEARHETLKDRNAEAAMINFAAWADSALHGKRPAAAEAGDRQPEPAKQ